MANEPQTKRILPAPRPCSEFPFQQTLHYRTLDGKVSVAVDTASQKPTREQVIARNLASCKL